MDGKEINKWEGIRQKGKLRYLAYYGILCWGIPIGCVCAVISTIRDKGLFSFKSANTLLGVVITGILYGIAVGCLYGLATWRINEKRFQRDNDNK